MEHSERLAKNNSYYDRFVSEVGARSEARDFTKALDLFLEQVDPTRTIVDIGCGSGTHLREFKRRGYGALGIEPSEKMRDLCRSQDLPVTEGSFETLHSLRLPDVSGIWCAASLLHVPREEIPVAFKRIADLLPSGAPLYFTVRLGDGSKWDSYDGASSDVARFIQLFNESDLLAELTRLPFQGVQSWTEDSTWGRPSKWLSVVAVKN